MLNFLTWYLTITLLGWLTFPLVYKLFPALKDRGYSLARAAGLLIWGYAFWLLASLGALQNNLGGILLGLAILVGLSAWAARTVNGLRLALSGVEGSIVSWLKSNIRLITTIEILFFLAFAFMAIIRAANPEALGTEKPMELAFINAILRSPTFPPRDPWLSGYAISYYHFGYILAAMLAKLTATSGSITFNLMTALVFALSAVGAYGILYNLLNSDRRPSPKGMLLTVDRFQDRLPSTVHGLPFLGPLFLLLVSNFEGFLAMLHQWKIFWPSKSGTFNFWVWLDMKELSQPPDSLMPIPDRFWWWWRASRVIQDYDLAGNFRETIDEFPFFSYLLGDLHPHVLSMPFALLAVAVALNLFLGGWRGKTGLFGWQLNVSKTGLFVTALVLGGLAFLNTWDILIAAALIAGAYLLFRVAELGWSWSRLEDFIFFGLLTGTVAILLYLPFYLGFASQAGGILPNLINPTRGAHLWVMFGTLHLPIFFWMIYLWRGEKVQADWKSGFALALGLLLFLWLFSWLMAWIAMLFNTDLAMTLLQSQGLTEFGELFNRATARRLEYIAGGLTLLLVTGGALSFLTVDRRRQTEDDKTPSIAHCPQSFVLLLITLGAFLVIAPEFFYLRDQFGTRMNTIFKFYYQAWILWSLAAAYGTAILLKNLRGLWGQTGIILLLAAALIYPALGLVSKTNGFNPPSGWTLDSAAHIARSNQDEAAAIAWLQSAPDGVIAEAVGGSYTGYARISTNTGLPTVLGWPGHESQWRGGYEEMGSRQSDIEIIYTSSDWQTTKALLDQYQIRYIYVGHLERATYHIDELKFQRFFQPVFSQGAVTIYAVP